MRRLLFWAIISIHFSTLTGQTFKPDNPKLYDTIVYLDSIFFNAYNTCDMELQSEFYSDNIEFFHDQGGLSNSKQDILAAIKNNICGKVTRERTKESIEVYPIANYGAIEIGLHRFHNNVENSTSDPSKFIIFWQKINGRWIVGKVVSLH
jgi:hypothetical protein